MNKYLLIILSFLVNYAFAQLNCDGFNPNTFQHTTSHWDLRDDTQPWDAYIGSGATNPTQWAIWSPFRSGLGNVNQLNTKHLYTQITELDYAPEEGWELIKKNFGTNTAGAGIDHPYFILYPSSVS